MARTIKYARQVMDEAKLQLLAELMLDSYAQGEHDTYKRLTETIEAGENKTPAEQESDFIADAVDDAKLRRAIMDQAGDGWFDSKVQALEQVVKVWIGEQGIEVKD